MEVDDAMNVEAWSSKEPGWLGAWMLRERVVWGQLKRITSTPSSKAPPQAVALASQGERAGPTRIGGTRSDMWGPGSTSH